MALETSPAIDVSSPTDMSWMCVLSCSWFAAFFVYFSYVPLWHTDIWGHVAYGQWILDHGRLPEFDPFVELARTTPLVATAWLSQVLFGILERSGGPERLSCAYAVVSVSIYMVLAWLFVLRTGRPGPALLCSILAWLIGWNRHLVIRPELLGILLLSLLLTLLTVARITGFDHRGSAASQPELSTSGRWSIRVSVALLFGLWANIHGSFAVGLAVVAILVVGAIVDCGLKTRSMRPFFTHTASRESLVLLVVAVSATLINPYGISLLAYVLTFSTNPNIASISEWQPPGMLSVTGLTVAGATALFLATLRFRPRRATPSEVLMLCLFTAAVCMRERMVAWYAPVAALLIAPNLQGIATRFEQKRWAIGIAARLARRSRVQTALIGFLIWITFCFAPISQPVLGGQPRSGDQLFRDRTPRGITEYLRNSAPTGRIANPQWWGDWLVWAGPPGLKVMMTTNAIHLVPAAHFDNYTRISWAHAGLKRCLDEYGIQLIVIDRSLQTELTEYALQSPQWQIGYADSQGLVAIRRPDVEQISAVRSGYGRLTNQ